MKEAKPSAQLGISGKVQHHKSAQKVQKKQAKGQLKKARKRQWKARQWLLMTMNGLHVLTKGHHARLAARRWVQGQLDSHLVTGQTANELCHFLKDRQPGRMSKGLIEKEDLTREAKAAWLRYLEELAIPAGVHLDIEAIFDVRGTGEAASEPLGMGEEEDNGVMLSPEPYDLDEEAAIEEEDKEGGGVSLGPLTLRPKQKEI